jgi:hypothetical protein
VVGHKFLKLTKLSSALTVSFFVISGCAEIPDVDIAFVDRRIPIGMDVSQAREVLNRRGFKQIKIGATPRSRFDQTSQSFIQLPLSETGIAEQNIGFVKLEGQPNGQLSCFARRYTRFIAAGDRLICWTVSEDDKITWRQAGWRGAGL